MGNNCVKNAHEKRKKTGFLSTIKTYLDRNRLGELLVLKGILDPKQLREALNIQQKEQMPLGYVLVKNDYISKKQLQRILVRQRATRFMATALVCVFAMSAMGTKRANAAAIKDVPAQIAVTKTSAEFQRVAYYPALFGSKEKRSGNLSAFTKWTGMFKRFEKSLNRGNSKELTAWRASLAQYQGQSISSMATNVNNLVNQQRYITDKKNWGKSDYWATPVEFLKRGGDCEDFAIAKYTALRALGVPEERLRLAIVHDNVKNIPHAILIVYAEKGPLFLDNQIKRVSNAASQDRYRPIFSINRTAWWLHTAPNGGTRVASAR